MLFGPSVGGMLIPWIHTQVCFFVATAGNLMVLLTIFLIRIPLTAHVGKQKSLTSDMIEDLSLAWQTPIFLMHRWQERSNRKNCPLDPGRG